MNLTELRDLAQKHVPDDQPDGQPVPLPMDGIFIVRHLEPSKFRTLAIGPFASLILQGQKDARVNEELMSFVAGQTSVLGHDLSMEYCVAKGSPDAPFLALAFQLDFDILRLLAGRIETLTEGEDLAAPLDCIQQDAALVNALGRYVMLANNKVDRDILGGSILEEMHLRLLQTKSSKILRQLLSRDSHASKIARAIAVMRENVTEPMAVDEIAASVGMGKTVFYEKFQKLTGKSPVNFVKDLRLKEARRLITLSGKPVSSAAYQVGYASASQFSRDYKQHFGVPPSADQA